MAALSFSMKELIASRGPLLLVQGMTDGDNDYLQYLYGLEYCNSRRVGTGGRVIPQTETLLTPRLNSF